jgi:hypothetical protein
VSRPDEGHACTLCGRRCRYARSVCSTCRAGVGLTLMDRRAGWAERVYPLVDRRGWPAEVLTKGHAAYARGLRDALTVARESEYQRRRIEQRRAAS